MKIGSFYGTDITKYNDIENYLIDTTREQFWGIGKSPLNISRYICFLKKVLKIYIKLKYQQDIRLIVSIPTIEEKMVLHDSFSSDLVKIRIAYKRLQGVLEGTDTNYENYIKELLEQLEIELTSNKRFSFIEYLTKQMITLTDISFMELTSTYSNEFLKNNLVKKSSWIKLSQHSTVFKDFYTVYMDNTAKKLFFQFLKHLLNKLN